MGTPTHRLLDGGNLSIPDIDTFHEMYSKCVLKNERIYAVALKTTPVFRMFFDMDIHIVDVSCVTKEWFLRLGKYVYSTLSELFDESITYKDTKMLMCTADLKQVRKNGVDCHKCGVHIHFPDIHLTVEMACRVRAAVAQKLANNFVTDGPTSWEDDVDETVYASNGLRMLYSRKSGRCTKCTSNTRDGCQYCFGQGKVDEGRAYTPLYTMVQSTEGQLQTLHEGVTDAADVLRYVSETCIRSHRSTPSHTFNESPPCWFEDPYAPSLLCQPAEDQEGQVKKKKRRVLTEGVSDVESSLSNKQTLTATECATISDWMNKMVRRKQLPKQYKGVKIPTAFSFTTNSGRSHLIARLDSQYCMNIGREHSTNTVYLEVNFCLKRAYMKCYCRCNTTEGRRKRNAKDEIMRCKEYRSDPIEIRDLALSLDSPTVEHEDDAVMFDGFC